MTEGVVRRNAIALAQAVCDGFTYDPGHSDLDNEQPITVRMTLGDYRRASQLLTYAPKDPNATTN